MSRLTEVGIDLVVSFDHIETARDWPAWQIVHYSVRMDDAATNRDRLIDIRATSRPADIRHRPIIIRETLTFEPLEY